MAENEENAPVNRKEDSDDEFWNHILMPAAEWEEKMKPQMMEQFSREMEARVKTWAEKKNLFTSEEEWRAKQQVLTEQFWKEEDEILKKRAQETHIRWVKAETKDRRMRQRSRERRRASSSGGGLASSSGVASSSGQ